MHEAAVSKLASEHAHKKTKKHTFIATPSIQIRPISQQNTHTQNKNAHRNIQQLNHGIRSHFLPWPPPSARFSQQKTAHLAIVMHVQREAMAGAALKPN